MSALKINWNSLRWVGLAALVIVCVALLGKPAGLVAAQPIHMPTFESPVAKIGFSSGTLEIPISHTGTTDVQVSNVVDLAGVRFHIIFPPAELQVVSTAAGAFFEQNGVPMPLIPTHDNAAGTVDFVGSVVPPAKPYSGAAPVGVGSITWKLVSCPASGQIPLTLVSTELSDPNGGVITHTRSAISILCPTPLVAPTNLKASAVSSSQITLTWAYTGTNQDGFEIERCTPNGCTNFALRDRVPANARGYSDTGLAAETTYCYRVRAYNAAVYSDYTTDKACATTTPPPNGVTVTGTVLLQGRTDHSGTTVYLTEDACPLVQALSFGLPNVVTCVTDEKGDFTCKGVEGKTYQCLLATHDMYLVARRSSMTVALPSVTLLGGNVVADKTINIFDLARIANSIGSTDSAVDINGDGKVDVYDLTIAAGNFGKEGPLPW